MFKSSWDRLVNGHAQHWEYKRPTGEQFMFELQLEKWQDFSVDLKKEEWWHLFTGAGNHAFGPKNPTFDVLASVIFEFGCNRSMRSLGHGKGVVELCDLRFE